ncbi:MAG: hypothetical protein MAGBODY4_01094 [Candidatus Marinimicrobia bacterium]|nr:hypothetical protein [Candidatus Neomarinimicrobiota bacterium]
MANNKEALNAIADSLQIDSIRFLGRKIVEKYA